jgi:small conductance mechanosensitive channel
MKTILQGLMVAILWLALPAHASDEMERGELASQILAVLESESTQGAYLEDILRRKNSEHRKTLSAALERGENTPALKQQVEEQIYVLETLLSHSDKTSEQLLDAALTAEPEKKAGLFFLTQQKISAADIYTQQLAETFTWAQQLDMETDNSDFLSELNLRAKGLSELILFLDERNKGLTQLAKLTAQEDVAAVEKQKLVYAQMQKFMLISLNVSVGLLESYNQDVTEYRQMLFTLTGDINSDILDFNVAYGLFSQWLNSFKDWALESTPTIVMKLLVFCLIIWVARILARLVGRVVKRSVTQTKLRFSVLMQEFFTKMASNTVMFIGLLIGLSQLGINLGPLLTGFGVAGVIIGFALQDTLSNFASGLMILIYRPFDVRDLVQVAGIKGNVSHMSLVSTTIRTLDNQTLVIPNNKIWGDVINNMTAERERRVDMVFGIGYQDNFDDAIKIIDSILSEHKMILATPEPIVRVYMLNESSVDIAVKPWVKTDDYWDVYYDVTEEVKRRFDAQGITIPFPQRDVHIYNENS